MCVFDRTSGKHEKNHLSGVADRNPLLIYSPIVDTNVCELIKKGEANGETEGFKTPPSSMPINSWETLSFCMRKGHPPWGLLLWLGLTCINFDQDQSHLSSLKAHTLDVFGQSSGSPYRNHQGYVDRILRQSINHITDWKAAITVVRIGFLETIRGE